MQQYKFQDSLCPISDIIRLWKNTQQYISGHEIKNSTKTKVINNNLKAAKDCITFRNKLSRHKYLKLFFNKKKFCQSNNKKY